MPTVEQVRVLYTGTDAGHDFDHVLRVRSLAKRLAELEGADLKIVGAAALLHDAPQDGQRTVRNTHHLDSADLARKVLETEGWNRVDIHAVQHCIRSHRFRSDERPATIEAMCVFDADKLDALGAIGVARAISYAALADEPYYVEPSESFLKSGEKEPGEPHSAYHEFVFKLRKLANCLYTASARELAERRHKVMTAFFERLRAEMSVKL